MRRVRSGLFSLASAAVSATALLAACSAQPSAGASPNDRAIGIAQPTNMGMEALAHGTAE
ncbi:MAG: hypothetical protein JWQ59_753 [Cryobacterium sp.]|nr:hypothetical protein [Cryobacterium sp.]